MIRNDGLVVLLTNIPDENHVVRYVRKRLLRRDHNNFVIGILPQALERREGEEYLSVTWMEHFDPIYENGFVHAAEAIRRQLEVKPKDGFSSAKAGMLRGCAETFGEKVRVVHEPVNPENTGHAAIRRLPKENLDLLDLLAAEAFIDTRVSSEVVPD